MTKQPSQRCGDGDTDQAMVKQSVDFQDNGGQQEANVEMDMQFSPVASHVDSDLAVPGIPDSNMVVGKHTPADHADLDAWINKHLGFDPFYNGKEALCKLVIRRILEEIAKQNGHKVDTKEMLRRHGWLQGFLITQWKNKSFADARRLGECPLYMFSWTELHDLFFHPGILQPPE